MFAFRSARLALAVLLFLLESACGGDKSAPPGLYEGSAGAGGEGGSAPQEPCAKAPADLGDTTLAKAYADHFDFGVALNGFTFFHPEGERAQLAATEFNRATAENAMKWSSLEPAEGEFNFDAADAFVDFARSHGMKVHGHVLVWHQQVPDWVFQADDGSPIDREALLGRLEDHMAVLADRYGGRVAYWDVLNEAVTENGELRVTPWRTILGDDYIEQVFAMADRYFPDAKLVYNDYNMYVPEKRDRVIRMVQDLDAAGVRIDAIGMQGHYQLYGPPIDVLEEALSAYADAGIEVLVTELDVDVLPRANTGADLDQQMAGGPAGLNPYAGCVPESVDAIIAERWGELFDLFVRHADDIGSVTTWGLDDGQSWLNDYPIEGRTNYPLLFDRQLYPKSNTARVVRAAND